MSRAKRKRGRRSETLAPPPRPEEAVEPEPVALPTMSGRELARERTLGRLAGGAAIASTLLSLAALSISSRNTERLRDEDASDVKDRDLLLDLHESDSDQVAAIVVRSISLLLLVIVAAFLFRAIRNRDPTHSPWVPAVGVLAFLAVGMTTALAFVELRDVAREFVGSGTPTPARAEDLLEEARDGGTLTAVSVVQLLANVLFGTWMALASMAMMNVGLLTRFLGFFGIGAGVTVGISLPIGSALFFGWLVSVGLLALGWWPGGRPPAWTEGRAIQWSELDALQAERRNAD